MVRQQSEIHAKPVATPQALLFIIVCCCVLLTIGCANTTSAIQSDERSFDALVAEALKQWQVPGAAVMVVNRDRAVYMKGHGIRELGKPEPITNQTVFPLASCSKAFTASLIAMLVDDGKITWDDPVRKHLPDFRLLDPAANEAVTIRDLLCHRTGLASHDELWYRSPWPVSEQIRRAGLVPPAHAFRTTFHYQSVMYSAAGLTAASAGGPSWDNLIRQRIFEPLGMRSATCMSNGQQRAMPHRAGSDGKLVPVPWYEQPQPNPAGSIHLTANDLAPWLMFQLGDGTWKGNRLLSNKNLDEMHTAQIVQKLEGTVAATHSETTRMSYGLGWVIQDYRGVLLWTHTGVIDGFRAQIAIAPKAGFSIAVLANRHETRMNLALVNSILDRLLGLPPIDWNARLQKVVADEADANRVAAVERDRIRQSSSPQREFSSYVGNYTHPAFDDCTVFLSGGALAWRWRGNVVPMTWDGGEQFRVDVPGLPPQVVTFEIVENKLRTMKLFDVSWTPK